MPNIIKTTIAFALSIAAATASAQHEVTIAIDNDDRATLSVLNTGPADIVAPVSAATGSWRAGVAAGCAVGLAKEVADMRSTGHTPSYRDAVVTCIGAAIGSQLGVSVAPIAGGVWVGKSWSF